MAFNAIDNTRVNAAKHQDDWYAAEVVAGKEIPYASLAAAYAAIPSAVRMKGRSCLVTVNGVTQEYWWKDDLSNNGLILKSSLVVTPEMFGAIGDGTVNDTASIQSAYAFITSKGGGTVLYRSEAVYGISSPIIPTLFSNTNFNGCTFNALNSFLGFVVSDTAIHHDKMLIQGGGAKFNGNGLVDYIIWFKSSKGLSIDNINGFYPKVCYFRFGDSASPNSTYELKTYNITGDTNRPFSLGSGSKGVWLDNVTDSWIETPLAISAENGIYLEPNCAKITISSGHAWAKGTSGGTVGTGDTKYCFYIQGSDITLISPYSDTPSLAGIYINAARVRMICPDFFNNPQQSKQNVNCILISQSSIDIQVISPVYRGNVTDSFLRDIAFEGTGSLNNCNVSVYEPTYVYTTNRTGTYFQSLKTRLFNTPLSFRNNGGAELSNIDTSGNFNGPQIRVTNLSARNGGTLSQIKVNDDKTISFSTDNIIRALFNLLGDLQLVSNISVERDSAAYYFRAGGAGLRAKIYSTLTNGIILASNNKDMLTIEDALVTSSAPVLATTYLGILGSAKIYSGSGNPEGSLVGSKGDIFLRTAGGQSTSIYFKSSGDITNTGWRSLASLTQPNVLTLTGLSPTIEAGSGFFYEYRWALTGNSTANAPQSPTNGQRILFAITQDATGGRLIGSWNAVYRFPNGITPTLSITPGSIDYIEFIYNSTDLKWDLSRISKSNYEIKGGVRTLASATTLSVGDYGSNGNLTVFADASGGAFTITLPTAASDIGLTTKIVKTDSSANTVTVKGNGTELINNANTDTTLSTQNASFILESNGTKHFKF